VDTNKSIWRATNLFVDHGVFIEFAPSKHAINQTYIVYVYEPEELPAPARRHHRRKCAPNGCWIDVLEGVAEGGCRRLTRAASVHESLQDRLESGRAWLRTLANAQDA